MNNRLIIVMGPTAVGKTSKAIEMAQQLDTHILSFDSRQFYSELNIGVARPTDEELKAAPHHFIACRSVVQPYNIFQYQDEAIRLLEQLFKEHQTVIAVGGSSLYAEALSHGVAVMPDPTPELRAQLTYKLQTEGVEALQRQLQELDPVYYEKVDRQNGIRLQRAIEVCLTAGKPYSEMIQNSKVERPFDIEYHIVETTPENLRNRINLRVDMMMQQGLVEEVKSLTQYRQLNTLNTVGYREIFDYFDGKLSLEEAVVQIKNHTWQYARKQLTWIKKLKKTLQNGNAIG